MIVWFLFRWQRTGQEIKTFGFDEVFADPEGLTYLIPVIGAIAGLIAYTSVRVVFWLAVFISLLPTSLWLYLNTGQIWLGCFAGLLGSFILAQYATFFALVLDKFFESGNL